jgi:hypothetical protein
MKAYGSHVAWYLRVWDTGSRIEGRGAHHHLRCSCLSERPRMARVHRDSVPHARLHARVKPHLRDRPTPNRSFHWVAVSALRDLGEELQFGSTELAAHAATVQVAWASVHA